jgi:hypothetical protein
MRLHSLAKLQQTHPKLGELRPCHGDGLRGVALPARLTGISKPWTRPIVGGAFAPNVGGPLSGYARLASLHTTPSPQ